MKSPATPLILLVECLLLLINLCVHLIILSLPYIKRFSFAAYRASKAYLKALSTTVEAKAQANAYYCLPLDGEGLIDTFFGDGALPTPIKKTKYVGALKGVVADISWAIAAFCRLAQSRPTQTWNDKQNSFVSDAGLGSRICE
jgi:hypothetical protein